jgi:DNA-binding response OmpR family regulator
MQRLLVVEDELKVASALRDGLATAGYEVVLCVDGEQGLLQAQRAAFDGAVLDLMLPRRDGLEILAALRACAPAMHGGSLDLVHSDATGSTFRMLLPLDRASA